MRRREPVMLMLKVWGGGLLVRAGVVVAAAWFLVPTGPLPVPGRDGLQSLVWPLVPVALAAAVPTAAEAGRRDLERSAARSVAGLRLRFSAGVLAWGLLVSVAGWRFDPAVVVRNTVLLLGLSLAATALLPAGVAWTPAVLLPMVCWLGGTGPGGVVRAWAVVLEQGESTTAWIVAGAAGMVGTLLHAAGDFRHGP